MRDLATFGGFVLAGLVSSIVVVALTVARAEPSVTMGQLYDGPVANCPWKPGMTGVLISACSGGQDCWENGGWICHMPKSESPDLKAKADADRRATANAHKVIVDAEVARLGGEYRRAEAERLVKMREEAEAARRRAQPGLGTIGPAQSAEGRIQPKEPAKPPEMCTFAAATSTISSDYFENKTLAAAGLRKRLAKACSLGVNGAIAGPILCRTLPSVTYADGKKEPSSECQVRYSCPAYQAPCASKIRGKPARARGT